MVSTAEMSSSQLPSGGVHLLLPPPAREVGPEAVEPAAEAVVAAAAVEAGGAVEAAGVLAALSAAAAPRRDRPLLALDGVAEFCPCDCCD
jgi:hypothetical protein